MLLLLLCKGRFGANFRPAVAARGRNPLEKKASQTFDLSLQRRKNRAAAIQLALAPSRPLSGFPGLGAPIPFACCCCLLFVVAMLGPIGAFFRPAVAARGSNPLEKKPSQPFVLSLQRRKNRAAAIPLVHAPHRPHIIKTRAVQFENRKR